MKQFTTEQIKELKTINPDLTAKLFDEIVYHFNDDYDYYIKYENFTKAEAFNQVKQDLKTYKVVRTSELLNEIKNYHLIKKSDDAYKKFLRYFLFNVDDDNYYYELTLLFDKAFTNLMFGVFYDDESDQIAFAFYS